MLKLILDETDYTSTLKASLDSYVKSVSEYNYGRAYTPHSTKQSFKSLENKSQCFDLIKRLTESSLLILEIKVTNNLLKLLHYNKRQHKLNEILRDINIPIQYCYNLADDYEQKNDDIYTLEYSNTSSPYTICNDEGELIQKDMHETLKFLVDSMLNKSEDGTDDNSPEDSDDEGNGGFSIGALFSKGFIERLQEINLKMLFFSYNVNSNELYILESDDLILLYEKYSEYVIEEATINMKTDSIEKIKEYFIEAQNKLKKTTLIYNNEIKEKYRQEERNRQQAQKSQSMQLGM